MRSVSWLLATLCFASLLVGSLQTAILVSSPAFGATITTINLNNAFPQTAATIRLSVVSCLSDCSATNPQGVYTCSLNSTNPLSAINHFSVTPATQISSNGAYTVCTVTVYNQLNVTDYINNNVGVNIMITVNPSCGSCPSYSYITSYTMPITPATTTATTSTTTTTTSTTTSTSTTTTPTTTTTTTPVSVTWTMTTSLVGSDYTVGSTDYTTTIFAQSPGGIATIVVASVVGAVVIGLVIYYSAMAFLKSWDASAAAKAKANQVTIRNASKAPPESNAPTYANDAGPSYSSYNGNGATRSQQDWSGTPRPFGQSSYYGQVSNNRITPLAI